ncbi:hypothetical protein ACU4GD_21110 [Cupriavidus basilensis]
MSYNAKVTATQSWHDIPTCKEQGLDVQYQMLRVFMLPGGVTPDQQKYYVDLMQKIVATPEWKEYLEKNAAEVTSSRPARRSPVPGEGRRNVHRDTVSSGSRLRRRALIRTAAGTPGCAAAGQADGGDAGLHGREAFRRCSAGGGISVRAVGTGGSGLL